jgi:hypothetical protein
MELKQLTAKEWELIQSIRNFKITKHNVSVQLEWYARQNFEILLYDYDEDEEN